ncbi:MAG: AraC family transcriptional regulator [Bacteroidota bacterium]
MDVTLFNFIYVLGVLQGIVLLLGINIGKPGQKALKKAMSILVGSITVAMLYYIVILNRYTTIFPYIASLGSAAWMAMFPAYYLLCNCLIDPKYQLQGRHFKWFLISLFFILEELWTIVGIPFSFYDLIGDQLHFLDIWMGLFFGTGMYFTYHSIRIFYRVKTSKIIHQLRWFSYSLLVVLIVFFLVFLFTRANYEIFVDYIFIGLFEFLIFAFIYKVFRILSLQAIFHPVKYSNKPIAQDTFQQLAIRLEDVMKTQQPYLDKNLKLIDLAELSGIKTNDLSQLFNEYYTQGFYEFVNAYRLRYLEQLMSDVESAKYTIEALAEKSGFNSKTTFYKVFKKKHKLTPKAYLKQIRDANSH